MRTISLTRRQFTFAAGGLAAGVHVRSAFAADEPYVVDAGWLQTRIASDPNLVILDASSISTYHNEHLKGAVHCWWQDTMELNNAIYGTTLSSGGAAARAQLLQDLGIDNTTMVVAYDGDDDRSAARMVWFLRWLGHSAAILDGGLTAWKASGGATEGGSNKAAKRGVPTISPHSSLLLETNRLQTRLKAGRSQLVDVRTGSEAKDDANGISRLGRIPGSISFPWTNAVDGGRLKSADQINAVLAQAGITSAKPVILYARYGFEADHAWVVLKSLGYGDVTVYDLGFVGWQANSSRPIDPPLAS